MFVIVQCWTNMKRDPTNIGLSIADKMGIALKHAGVSITVTSLTDVFAFGVGAVTVSYQLILFFLAINMQITENAWTRILLCLYSNWAWINLSVTSILVCGVDDSR